MKRPIIIFLLALALALPACVRQAAAPSEDPAGQVETLMRDLAANAEQLSYLLPGGAYGSLIPEWPLGENLPRQPVHALIVAAAMPARMEQLCPRWVVEYHISAEEYLAWLEQSVDALSRFRMADPVAEAMRRQCLESCLAELRSRDQWYPVWGL